MGESSTQNGNEPDLSFPNALRSQLVPNTASSSDAASVDDNVPKNCVAITFDAASINFDLFHPHPIIASRKEPRGDLKSLISCACWSSFECWVTDKVRTSPWDSTLITDPYPFRLAISS